MSGFDFETWDLKSVRHHENFIGAVAGLAGGSSFISSAGLTTPLSFAVLSCASIALGTGYTTYYLLESGY